MSDSPLNKDLPEALLIEAWKRNEKLAYDYIYKEFYEFCLNYAYEIVKDEYAEDLVADVFFKLIEKRPSFDSIGSIRAFLFVSTRNRCYDHFRHIEAKRQAAKEILFLSTNAGNTGNLNELDEKIFIDSIIPLLEAGIKNLPPKRGEVFRMLFYERKTNEEVAKCLKIKVSVVRDHKSKAIQYLRMFTFGNQRGL